MTGSAETDVRGVRSGPFTGTGAVFRHELRLLLFAPLSYLFQIVFLVVLSACIFLIADFYNTDEASIQTMLAFLPWVSLILVPALATQCSGYPVAREVAQLAQ